MPHTIAQKTLALFFFISISITAFAQNQALDLSGAGNEVNVTYDLNTASGFTVEQWIYIPTLTAGVPLVNQTSSNLAAPLDAYVTADGRASLFLGDGATFNTVETLPGTISAGTWYHVVLVYDPLSSGTEGQIFIDGSSVITVAEPAGFINTGPIRIGRRADAFEGDDFYIDEVRLWSIARGGADITTDYDAKLTGDETGLEVYLQFENNLTDDALGNGNQDGSVVAGSIGYVAGAPLQNNALDFDGLNDYVSLTRTQLPTGMTYEAWINTSSIDATANYIGNPALTIVGDQDNGIGLSLGVTGGVLDFHHFNGSNWNQLLGTIPVNDGNWHHVAVTHNVSNEVILYVDGQLDETVAITYDATYHHFNRIGSSFNAGVVDGDFFDGLIDQVRIWDNVRTQEQIVADAYTILSAGAGLVASYDFNVGIAGSDNGTVLTLPDLTVSANNGMLNGPFDLIGSSSNWVTSTAFDNDIFAPIFLSGYPLIDNINPNGFDITVQLNETGTYFYVVVTDGDPAPIAAEISLGTGSGGSGQLDAGSTNVTTASTDFTITSIGLLSGADYDVYIVAQDDEGSPNLQTNTTFFDVTIPCDIPVISEIITDNTSCSLGNGILMATASSGAGEPVGNYTMTIYDGVGTGGSISDGGSATNSNVAGGVGITALNLFSGSYTVEVINNDNGCSDIQTYVIADNIINPTINVGSIVSVNESFPGANDGLLDATGTASGGSGSYTYQWFSDAGLTTPVGTGPSILTLTAGTYFLQVTDDLTFCVSTVESADVIANPALLDLISTTPLVNANNVLSNQVLSFDFDVDVDLNSINNFTVSSNQTLDDNITIIGNQTGITEGTWAIGGDNTIVDFTPSSAFKSGEIVTVTVTDQVLGSGAEVAETETFQFTAESQVGPGTFPLAGNEIVNTTDGPQSIYAADIDGDGDLDMVTTSELNSEVSWYENDGTGNFVSAVISTNALSPRFAVASDLDNDGNMDIITSSGSDNEITWFQNDGSENFTEQVLSTSATQGWDIYVIDLDGDGDMDILNAALSTVGWYENDGSENFTYIEIANSLSNARWITAGDLDNDGDLDVVSGEVNNARIAWYENDGNQGFTAQEVYSGSSFVTTDVQLADMDNDGDLDMVNTAGQTSQIFWFENDGAADPTFSQQVFATTAGGGGESIYVVDLEGDGDQDVLMSFSTDNSISLFTNDGLTDPTFSETTIVSGLSGTRSVYAGDMDGDGDVDVLGTSYTDDKVVWYEQSLPSPPAAPTNFIAYESAGNIVLEWTDNATDETGFLVERADDYLFTIGLIDITSTVGNPGIDATTGSYNPIAGSYYYRVTAVNGFEDASSQSSVEFATTEEFPGYALAMDGVADEVATTFQESLDDFTVETWVNFNDFTTTQRIVDMDGGGVMDYWTIYQAAGSGIISADLRPNGGSNTTLNGVTPLMIGTWYHVAFVRDGTTISLYLNGVLEASNTKTAFTFSPVNPLRLGGAAQSVGQNTLNGILDEVRVWDVAKTDFSDRFSPLQGNEANLAAYYPFDEGVGATNTVDRSQNTNDGALNGGIVSVISNVPLGPIPAAPTNFIAYESAGNIVLEWTDNATDETGFIIERADDYAFTTPVDITSLAGNPGVDATAATFNPSGIDYYYRVTAVNGFEDASSQSSIEFATTEAFPGQALSFDGANDYIELPLIDLNSGNSFTLEAWIKPDDITTNGSSVIIRQNAPNGTYDFYLGFEDNGTTLRVGVTAGSQRHHEEVVDPAYFTDGNWHHVAGTYNGSTLRIYIDGELQGGTGKTGNVRYSPGGFSAIGAETDDGISYIRYFDGLIDEVTVYNIAKSDFSDLVTPLLGNEANLIAYYPFDEGVGSTIAVDRSVNTNDGLLNGGISSILSDFTNPPIIEDAIYSDTDSDGNIDQVSLVFDRLVDINDVGEAGDGLDVIQLSYGPSITLDVADYTSSGVTQIDLNFLGDQIPGTDISGITLSYQQAGSSEIVLASSTIEIVDADTPGVTTDAANPILLSFGREAPSSEITNADNLTFRAEFSEGVSGTVDAADFTLSGTTATVTGVSPISALTYDVTISGGDLASINGVVGLDLDGAASITDVATNSILIVEPTTDETYTLDNTAPTITAFDQDGLSINMSGLILTGTIDEFPAVISVSIDGGTTFRVAVDNGNGTWSYDLGTDPALVSETFFPLDIQTMDAAGNSQILNTSGITYDITAPSVGFDQNGLTTNNFILTGTVDDPTATITVSTDGGSTFNPATNNGSTWDFDLTPLYTVDGLYSITIEVTDAAGNLDNQPFTGVVIDNTAPVITFNQDGTETLSTIIFGTTDDDAATINISLDGGTTVNSVAVGSGTWNYDLSTDPNYAFDGIYNIRLDAADALGNANAALNGTITLDLIAPIVTVDAFSTGDINTGLTGTIDDNFAIIDVLVNSVSHTATNNGDGTWSIAQGVISLGAFGPNEIEATAIDVAGNVGTDATLDEITLLLPSASFQTEVVTGTTILAGSTDQLIYKVSMTVANGGITTAGFYFGIGETFSASDFEVDGFKLYEKVGIDDLSTATLINGTGVSYAPGAIVPTGDVVWQFANSFVPGDVVYYYVTVNLSTGAVENNTFNVTLDGSPLENFVLDSSPDKNNNGLIAGEVFTIAVLAPEIEVTGLGNEIVSGDDIPDLVDDTDFGSVEVSQVVTKTYTINNLGTGDLNLGADAVSISGDTSFEVGLQPDITVSVGGITTFTITFTPLVEGPFSGQITILNDDSDESPYTFDVTGTATLSPPVLSDLLLTADATLVDVELTVDSESDLYYVITTSDTPASEAQVLSGLDGDGNPGSNFGNFGGINATSNFTLGDPDFTGPELLPSTTYYIYWVAQNVNGNSAVLDDTFTTLEQINVTFSTETLTGTDVEVGTVENLVYSFSLTSDAETPFEGIVITFDNAVFDPAVDLAGSTPVKLWSNTTGNFGDPKTDFGSFGFGGDIGGRILTSHETGLLTGGVILPASTPVYFYVTVDVSSGAIESNQIQVIAGDIGNDVGLGDAEKIGTFDAGEFFNVSVPSTDPFVYFSTIGDVSTATFVQSVLPDATIRSRGFDFNLDGTKLFRTVDDEGEIASYSLSTPFDLSSAAPTALNTLNFGPDATVTDIVFSYDGLTLFTVDQGVAPHTISFMKQYDLSVPFDISTAIDNDVTFSIASEITRPQAIAISNDGSKIFISGFQPSTIFQYDLGTPFDLTSTQFNNVTIDVSTVETNVRGIEFNASGTALYMLGSSINNIVEYSLSTPFELNSATLTGQVLDVSSEQAIMDGLRLSTDGTKLFIVGVDNGAGDNCTFHEYALTTDAFIESAADDGSLEGAMILLLQDEFFANAGGTLSFGTDYDITNLPTGLTPSLDASNDGLTATLTLAGTASSHTTADDLLNLQLTLSNTAFVGGDASIVTNAQTGNSNLGINFVEDTNPLILGPSGVQGDASSIASIDENTSEVHTFAADESVTWSFGSGSDDGLFSFTTSGLLSFTVAPDFENPSDGNTDNVYEVIVVATDVESNVSSQTVSITVTDTNDNTPTITDPGIIDISENSTVGTSLISLIGNDMDTNTTLNWGLGTGNSDIDSDGTPAFDINSSTGEITVLDQDDLDFEFVTSFSLQALVDDGVNTGSLVLSIDVTDLDEDAPSFTSSTTSSADENIAITTVIYTAVATDAGTITYSLSGTDASLFTLDGATGELTFVSSPDFETPSDANTDNSYEVTITATDDATNSTDLTLTIIVNDLDEDAPSVTLSSTSTSPTSTTPIVVDVVFSESVTGLLAEAFTVSNGTASNLQGTGTTYTVDITPDADGEVTVDLAAGVAQDAAGNDNTAATQFSITSDQTLPTVVISSAAPNPTNAPVISVDITFGGSVTGFEIEDITVTNGTTSNFTGSGTTYSVDITPSADGEVTVDIPAGVAQDGSGNDNTAATQFIITSDQTAPVVTVAISGTSKGSPSLSGTIDDENATINVEVNASSYTPTIAGNTWTIAEGTITPDLADGTYEVIATATDVAGNVSIDDTENELTISQTVVVLQASNITSSSFQVNWSEGESDVVGYELDVSVSGDFTTFVSGYEAKSLESTTTSEVVTDLDFQTAYFYRVRLVNSSGAQGDSNTGTATTIINQETEDDFAALATIYDETGGPSWSSQKSWLADRLQDWEDVTIDPTTQRVTGVDLSSNNLAGSFPLTPALDQLTTLNLSGNSLENLSDLSELAALSNLDVSENALGFDDLEPVAGITTVVYANQASITFDDATGDPIEVRYTSDYSLSVTLGGSANSYQWFRKGNFKDEDEPTEKPIEESDEEFFVNGETNTILEINYYNMGEFRVEIINTLVPGLTINVNPQEILAIADLTMTLSDEDGALITNTEIFDAALIDYIVPDPDANNFSPFDTLKIANGVRSEFILKDVVLGDYICGIDPENPDNYIATYFGNVFQWDNPDIGIVELRADATLDIVMEVKPVPFTEENGGDGILDIVIEEDFGDDAGRIDARRRAARRKCGLRRKTGGGRTDEDADGFSLIAYGETDDNGEFQFGFLPAGTYRFFVEYPGIPLDDDSFVEFEVGEAGISDTDFKLEAFASEDGLEVTINVVLGVILDYFKDLAIYPNPANNELFIKYRHLKSRDVTAELVDLTGATKWSQELSSGYNGDIEIDVRDMEEGVYILYFYDRESRDENVVSYRIIIQH